MLKTESGLLTMTDNEIKAIKEFAEKLKERNEDFCVDKSDMAFVVDSIVKEMTEGENG